jgi:PIN like domain
MVPGMANLRDQFAPYYAPGEEVVAAALRTGLVTPDANVMLAAYRFERKSRDELLRAFERLEDRLWIPHQVALEFHRNRLGVIAAQEAFFGTTQAELDKAVGAYLEKLKAFANRIAMPHLRAQKLEQMVRHAHAQVKSQVSKAEEANEVHLDRRDSDEVLIRLEALFDGRVGDPMEPDVLAEARKEAKRRIENKIPPGYADKDKADPSGDYLVWKQLLGEAAVRRVPVVLVTDDRKEDWVRRAHGLTLGPRPELCEEMSAAASVPFLLMSTAAFLRNAKEYLSVTVSPETVEQARELPDVQAERRRAMTDEMYAQASTEFEQLHRQLMQAEMEAARVHEREEGLHREYANQTTPDRLQVEAELEASRASRALAEGKIATLRKELDRAVELMDAIDHERATRRRSQKRALEEGNRVRLAQLRGAGGEQSLGPPVASICRMGAQTGVLAEDSAGHDQVELSHGKEKLNGDQMAETVPE